MTEHVAVVFEVQVGDSVNAENLVRARLVQAITANDLMMGPITDWRIESQDPEEETTCVLCGRVHDPDAPQ